MSVGKDYIDIYNSSFLNMSNTDLQIKKLFTNAVNSKTTLKYAKNVLF